MRLLVLLVASMTMVACEKPSHRVLVGINQFCGDGSPAWAASLSVVLIDRREFLDRCVLVKGFMGAAPGLAPSLFLTQEHAVMRDTMSSIALTDDTEEAEIFRGACVDHHVEVMGKLKEDEMTGLPILSPIDRIRYTSGDAWPKICWERTEAHEPPNKALELTLDPAVLFAVAKSPSASSAAQLGR